MPHVVTEHHASLADAARALGVRGLRITELDALGPGLRNALASEGTTLLEVVVPPHDAELRERRLRAAMESA
jgi:thiamine pyrophosphate-dependent acetolactate synthase large subunit-like protein